MNPGWYLRANGATRTVETLHVVQVHRQSPNRTISPTSSQSRLQSVIEGAQEPKQTDLQTDIAKEQLRFGISTIRRRTAKRPRSLRPRRPREPNATAPRSAPKVVQSSLR